MKCLVKKEASEGLWIEERPIPSISSNDVLIKTRKMSICGTDVHIYKWDSWAQKTIPVPLIIGHEFMGEIVEIGSNVTGYKVGDRVSAEGHLTCGICPNCKKGKKYLCANRKGVGIRSPGCFAEYISLPAENIFKLPDTVSDSLAAIFDPYGNAVHTALQVPLTAEDVLITGAGPIGIMAAAIAKHAGARNVVVTDISDYRLNLASQMGATKIVNIMRESLQEQLPSIGITHGFTVGMEMSGTESGLRTLLETAQHGAHIALLGIFPNTIQIDWDLVIFKLLTLKGVYGREGFSTWYQMVHLLEGGLNLAPIITHHIPFEEFDKGFEIMLSGKSGKVILEW